MREVLKDNTMKPRNLSQTALLGNIKQLKSLQLKLFSISYPQEKLVCPIGILFEFLVKFCLLILRVRHISIKVSTLA